jgi:hypothetical protein
MTTVKFPETGISHALIHPDAAADHYFLKALTAHLDNEDHLTTLHHLIYDSDPAGINAVVGLMVCIYHLRAEINSWVERWQPGLSPQQYARIGLKRWSENCSNPDAILKLADYFYSGIEEGCIDWVCGFVDDVCELRDELVAWAELAADEKALPQ